MQHESCILLVDYVATRLFLDRQRSFSFSEAGLGQNLIDAAGQSGTVIDSYIFSDLLQSRTGEDFKNLNTHVKPVLPGKLCASNEIGREVAKMSQSDQLPNTVILVAGDESYLPVIDYLHQINRKVILWWFTENNQPAFRLVVNAADDFQSLDNIITPELPRTSISLAREYALAALIISLDDLMVVRETEKLPYLDCAAHAANVTLLNGEGIIHLDGLIAEGAVELSFHSPDDYAVCRLNALSPRVQKVLGLRDRLLMTLDSILQGRKWVAFNHLERSMRGHKVFGYDETSRRNWIEILIAEGLILAEQKDNPHRTNGPITTALMLNFNHPVLHQYQGLLLSQMRRMIVICDMFLTNRNYRWVAASTLIKLMSTFLPEKAVQNLLSYALDEAVISIAKLPNSHNPDRSISAVQLNPDNELVQQTMKMRDTILMPLLEIYKENNVELAYSALLSALSDRCPNVNRNTLSFWIELFIRTGVVRRGRKSLDLRISFYTINKNLPVFAFLHRENG